MARKVTVKTSGAKRTLKTLGKKSKKAGKAVKKFAKSIKKAYRQHKRNSALSTRQIQNLINKAKENLDKNKAKLDELEHSNVRTMTFVDYDKKMEQINKLQVELTNKGKLSSNKIQLLREWGGQHYYDKLVYISVDVKDKERSSETMDFTKPSEYKTLDKVYKIVRDESKGKELKEDEEEFARQFSKATASYHNYENVPIMRTSEDVQEFLKKTRNKQVDLSIGGMSSLLNDLRYIEGDGGYKNRNQIGKDLVKELRDFMQSDKTVYAKIEKWYQSAEGLELKALINSATGSNYYKYLQLISVSITKLIKSIRRMILLDEQRAEKFEELENTAEKITSGYMDEQF